MHKAVANRTLISYNIFSQNIKTSGGTMLGHTFMSFLINGVLLLLIGLAVHAVSYFFFTKPVVSWKAVITFALLSAFTYAFPILGYIFSILVAIYLIWREDNLYRLGAIAFLVALLLTAISLFIGGHLMLVIPVRF